MEDHWGKLGHLTEQQKEALAHFQERLSEDPGKGTGTGLHSLQAAKFTVETEVNASLRFLRARQFDVAKALELLHTCQAKMTERRAAHYADADVEETLGCEMNVLRKFYPHNQVGHDKSGRPLLFENSGLIDMTAIHHLTTQEQLVGYHFWTMERALNNAFTTIHKKFKQQGDYGRESYSGSSAGANDSNRGSEGGRRNGSSSSSSSSSRSIGSKDTNEFEPPPVATCCIVDLSGLTLSAVTSSTALNHMKLLVQLDNLVYPEMLGKMFVLNAPSFVVGTFDIVKQWLDVRTQRKIEFLGSDRAANTARLLQFIDEDQLPIRYGGTSNAAAYSATGVPLLGDVYTSPHIAHPHCEYVALSAGQVHSVNMSLPAHAVLVIDSYVKQGSIEVTVTETVSSSSSSSSSAEDGEGQEGDGGLSSGSGKDAAAAAGSSTGGSGKKKRLSSFFGGGKAKAAAAAAAAAAAPTVQLAQQLMRPSGTTERITVTIPSQTGATALGGSAGRISPPSSGGGVTVFTGAMGAAMAAATEGFGAVTLSEGAKAASSPTSPGASAGTAAAGSHAVGAAGSTGTTGVAGAGASVPPPPRDIQIQWRNPTTSVMSHKKVLVYAWRIVE